MSGKGKATTSQNEQSQSHFTIQAEVWPSENRKGVINGPSV